MVLTKNLIKSFIIMSYFLIQRVKMKEMNILEFAEELKNRRSKKTTEIPEFNIEKRDVLSESCLGLCVE